MANGERKPFDPGDAGDAMAEMFRRQVTEMALAADKVTLYRDMSPQEQLQCFVAGALTGVVGVALASVKTEGADVIMEYIEQCLPFARQQAEGIRDESGNPVINHHDAAE